MRDTIELAQGERCGHPDCCQCPECGPFCHAGPAATHYCGACGRDTRPGRLQECRSCGATSDYLERIEL